jgi:hypothetical protein
MNPFRDSIRTPVEVVPYLGFLAAVVAFTMAVLVLLGVIPTAA